MTNKDCSFEYYPLKFRDIVHWIIRLILTVLCLFFAYYDFDTGLKIFGWLCVEELFFWVIRAR